MLTKSDFDRAIADTVVNYPSINVLYKAGDPRIRQSLEAMAAMLALQSQQIEVALAEPFDKVRDATILADAAMRGIIRKATPSRVQITAVNNNDDPFNIDINRNVLDSIGRVYKIDTLAVVPANGSVTFEAVQVKTEQILHTVANSVAFYAIEIAPDDDSYLSGIAVSGPGGNFEHKHKYINTGVDDLVFHVETDDRQRMYVRFGQSGIVGTQPADGDLIILNISRSFGKIDISYGSPFSFEYTQTANDAFIEMTMDELLLPGNDPLDMSSLRDLAKYPSVYDSSAVFLGEFEYMVRINHPDLQFLSIWNETAEEKARGSNIDNINVLFVAMFSGTEDVLNEVNPFNPVPLEVIAPVDLNAAQLLVLNTINTADDAYRIKFIKPITSEISIDIRATVSSAYITNNIYSKIREIILNRYGISVTKGNSSEKPLYKDIYDLLIEGIPVLKEGSSDVRVTIEDTLIMPRPELWRYVSEKSLSVSVIASNVATGSWGANGLP